MGARSYNPLIALADAARDFEDLCRCPCTSGGVWLRSWRVPRAPTRLLS